MSRIGKKPIAIPAKTDVAVVGNVITVKGPQGELSLTFRAENVTVAVADGFITVTNKDDTIESRALWGTYGSEILAMVQGVHTPFTKKLLIEGVGYKAELRGDTLVLNIGFSHEVPLKVPAGLTCAVEKNAITISGISKEKVGQFAAVVRSQKKPEPYKGKGIRYDNEVIRRKEGKKAS
ncbi:MAG: hypothetical protein RL150_707 [Candidatus Parcubacteria bacterium]|jgi:large subunit ribosomal protein L6